MTQLVSLRSLMIAAVGAISATALVAMFVVLSGNYGSFQTKVILTTLTIGYFTLMSACTLGDGKVYTIVGPVGLGLGAIGTLMALHMIWQEISPSENISKLFACITVVSFALAHGTVNYRLSGTTSGSLFVLTAANIAVSSLAAMLIQMILQSVDRVYDAQFRMIIALSIASVALSIANPIVARLSNASAPSA